MSKKEIIIGIIGVVLVLSFLYGTLVIWTDDEREYEIGYEMGVHQTALYHQATGKYPCQAWRTEYMNDDSIQTTEDIIRTDICY